MITPPAIKAPTIGGSAAFPSALMFIAGLGLLYWALSGWKLFGLGGSSGIGAPAGVPIVLPTDTSAKAREGTVPTPSTSAKAREG